MADPLFYLQIVDRHGKVVAGPLTAGKLEADLIQLVLDGMPKRIRWMLWAFGLTRGQLATGIGKAFQHLKDETRLVATRHR